jgi:hypothetical protein
VVEFFIAFPNIGLGAVVRGKNDNGVFGMAGLLKRLEELADGVVGFNNEVAARTGLRSAVELVVGDDGGVGRRIGEEEEEGLFAVLLR